VRDAESGKTLVFLTNQFGLPATTVCALYKSRWQVELFFKWIEQHLRIKQFFGTSENAVKTQIWIRRLGLRPRRHRQEAPQHIEEAAPHQRHA
jgi:IS4 transposase